MEKRLDKVHLKKEKIYLGCSWSFSDVFNFKIGGRNQKLLTNGIPRPKNVLDSGEPRNVNMLSITRRKSTDIDEGRQQMEIHMDHEKSPISMPLGLLLKKHKKTIIPSNKDEFFQSLTSSDKHIISKMLEEFHNQENGTDNMRRNVISPLNQYEMHILQMRAKAFIDNIYVNRRRCNIKNGVNRESKQFLEAADVLNLNMDLFLKVLQDPYPVFVKNIKNLQILPRNREKTTKTKGKDANGLRAKGKFGNVCSPKSKVKQTSEDVSCHCSSHQKSLKKDKGQIKRASFSSLKDIFTRKIRENKNKCVSTREMLAISSDEVHHKPVEMEPGSEKVDMKQQKVDIFIEAKRRLSERLKSVDSGEIKEAPRTLKMILSSRDSDMSESNTLKGHHNSDSDEKRCSLYRHPEMALDSCSLQNERLKTVCFPVFPKQAEDTSLFTQNTSSTPGGLKRSDCSEVDEAINGLSYKTTESCEDSGYIERLNLTTADDYESDSSSRLDICKVQIVENNDEKEEYRSPVSVLEPFSFEEISCVPISKPIIYIDEQDPVSLYVRTILEVSGLNLNESSINEPLHPDFLQSFIPSEVDSDIKILLECINQAIAVVYESGFGWCYPWKFCLKPKFKVAQEKERFIDEVVKEVNSMNFVTKKTEKLTIDQLVMKDNIAGFDSWIDLHDDAEHILVQLAEDVLYDLIMNTISEI